MSRRQLTKGIKRDLKDLGSKLPIVFYQVKESGRYTGQELILVGLEKDEKGQALIPDKIYLYEQPVQIAVNHYRRMRKAWEMWGYEGVNKYVDKINLMEAAQLGKEITIRAN
jgi:hypothetical protein